MPIVVGVILGIALLVAFSEWFYHIVIGWREVVLDDKYYGIRMVSVALLSFFIISATFLVSAYVTGCPNQETEGLFSTLKCDEYLNIQAGAEGLFKSF